MKNLKTIVIHPFDETTHFLQEIYKDKDFHVLSGPDFPKESINPLMKKYDRVLLLGHGLSYGLLSGCRLFFDRKNAAALQGKAVIGIWCYARQFMFDNKLEAFSTNMFISEKMEANTFSIDATSIQIEYSNQLFTRAVSENLHLPPNRMRDEVLKIYRSDDNPVIQFNYRQMRQPLELLTKEMNETGMEMF